VRLFRSGWGAPDRRAHYLYMNTDNGAGSYNVVFSFCARRAVEAMNAFGARASRSGGL
jgi:hypothetical protein